MSAVAVDQPSATKPRLSSLILSTFAALQADSVHRTRQTFIGDATRSLKSKYPELHVQRHDVDECFHTLFEEITCSVVDATVAELISSGACGQSFDCFLRHATPKVAAAVTRQMDCTFVDKKDLTAAVTLLVTRELNHLWGIEAIRLDSGLGRFIPGPFWNTTLAA